MLRYCLSEDPFKLRRGAGIILRTKKARHLAMFIIILIHVNYRKIQKLALECITSEIKASFFLIIVILCVVIFLDAYTHT